MCLWSKVSYWEHTYNSQLRITGMSLTSNSILASFKNQPPSSVLTPSAHSPSSCSGWSMGKYWENTEETVQLARTLLQSCWTEAESCKEMFTVLSEPLRLRPVYPATNLVYLDYQDTKNTLWKPAIAINCALCFRAVCWMGHSPGLVVKEL